MGNPGMSDPTNNVNLDGNSITPLTTSLRGTHLQSAALFHAPIWRLIGVHCELGPIHTHLLLPINSNVRKDADFSRCDPPRQSCEALNPTRRLSVYMRA